MSEEQATSALRSVEIHQTLSLVKYTHKTDNPWKENMVHATQIKSGFSDKDI